MLFRSSFCSIGAREMLRSSSLDAGESVEKSMKSHNFDEISDIFEHFGGMEAPSGQSCQKIPKKAAPGSENVQKVTPCWSHVGSFLETFFDVFLGTLPEGLFAVMGAILCNFGAPNGVKTVKQSIFLEKCRHAFGLRVGPLQIAPIIQKKRVINPTRF